MCMLCFIVCSGFLLLFFKYDSLNNSKKLVLLNVACLYTCLLRDLKVDNSSYLQLLSNKMLMAVMVFTALLKPLQSQMSNSLLIGYCLLYKLVCSGLCVVLQVLALRRPFLHRVLDYEDEFFALLMLVLETHSLRTTDASFSESLYGLRRRAVNIKVKKDDAQLNSADEIHHSGLRKRQKVLSVVFLVVLPYLKSKLYSIYNKEREARLQASLWGHGDESFDDTDYIDGREDSLVSRGNLDTEASLRTRLTKRIHKIIGACYPWLHASSEGASFSYQLLYLLDATGFYSVGLHALGIHVCRATGQELMDTSSRISKIRSRERERLRGPPWLKALQGALLSCVYTSLDYAQTGLIAAVFFFKMMEWWYQSAEERMSAPTVYPPPPPPPPPKAAEEGLPLPPNRTICPLCSQKRANPSVVTVSGFVFCYACIFKYVSQYKRCPITLMPATVDHIRRLFHDV